VHVAPTCPGDFPAAAVADAVHAARPGGTIGGGPDVVDPSWATATIAGDATHNAEQLLLECNAGVWKVVQSGSLLDDCTVPANVRAELQIGCEQVVTGVAPTTPFAVASDFFTGWQNNDNDMMQTYADASGLSQAHAARLSGSSIGYTSEPCQGAAGSSYCVYTGPADRIVIRVDNQSLKVVGFSRTTKAAGQ
jgi:hypothetical protein